METFTYRHRSMEALLQAVAEDVVRLKARVLPFDKPRDALMGFFIEAPGFAIERFVDLRDREVYGTVPEWLRRRVTSPKGRETLAKLLGAGVPVSKLPETFVELEKRMAPFVEMMKKTEADFVEEMRVVCMADA